MLTDPATTAEEARAALIADATERWVRGWHDDGLVDEATREGRRRMRRDFVADVIDGLSSVFIDVPCETCEGDTEQLGGQTVPVLCWDCNTTGHFRRRALDVFADKTREAG